MDATANITTIENEMEVDALNEAGNDVVDTGNLNENEMEVDPTPPPRANAPRPVATIPTPLHVPAPSAVVPIVAPVVPPPVHSGAPAASAMVPTGGPSAAEPRRSSLHFVFCIDLYRMNASQTET